MSNTIRHLASVELTDFLRGLTNDAPKWPNNTSFCGIPAHQLTSLASHKHPVSCAACFTTFATDLVTRGMLTIDEIQRLYRGKFKADSWEYIESRIESDGA